MSPDKEAKLLKKYPKMLKGMTMVVEESCLAFGIECGDGWYKLIDGALSDIKAIDPDTQIAQIKQKYGTLNMYLGSASDEAFDIADVAEVASHYVCEICGEPGRLNRGPWFLVRCESCE